MKGKLSVVPWLLVLLLLCASSTHAATIAWSTLRGGVCSAVAVAPSPLPENPSVLYASFAADNVGAAAVLRSDDAGATWTAVLPLRAYSLATTPRSPGRVYAATDNGLFSSADYGASWMQLAAGSRGFVAVNAGNDNILYLDNYRSVDGGRSWFAMSGLPAPGGVPKSFHLKTSAGDPSFLIAFSGYSVQVSHDGGATWTNIPGAGRSDFYSAGLDPVDARYFFVGYCNYIQRWHPGGTTMPVASGDIYAIEADPGAHNKVFASGQGSAFYYSGNYGYSWEASSSGGTLTHYGRMVVDGAEGRLYLPSTTGLRVMSTDALPSPPPVLSVTLGGGIDNGTAFVARSAFMPGQPVLFRARFVELGSGLPSAGAAAVVRVSGPATDNLVSELSGADGYAYASWTTLDPTPWKYSATVVSVFPPAGSSWNGTQASFVFTEGPATVASAPMVGSYPSGSFVESGTFVVGDTIAFRTRVTDPNTGAPVPGALVDFSVLQGSTSLAGSATSDADGWAELQWVSSVANAYSAVWVTRIVPPPGYVWIGYSSLQVRFAVAAPPLVAAGVPSIATGKYQTVKKVTTWVSTAAFKAGDTVVFNVAVADATGAPVNGAVVTLSVYGPSGTGVTTSPSAGGIAVGTWKSYAPSRKSTGTTPGDYLATVTSVTMPAGYIWDGVVRSVPIAIQ